MCRIRVLSGIMALFTFTMTSPDLARGSEAEGQQPSLELLEYLADMVADEEGWVGPGDFQQYVIPDQIVIYDDSPDSQADLDSQSEELDHE